MIRTFAFPPSAARTVPAGSHAAAAPATAAPPAARKLLRLNRQQAHPIEAFRSSTDSLPPWARAEAWNRDGHPVRQGSECRGEWQQGAESTNASRGAAAPHVLRRLSLQGVAADPAPPAGAPPGSNPPPCEPPGRSA